MEKVKTKTLINPSKYNNFLGSATQIEYSDDIKYTLYDQLELHNIDFSRKLIDIVASGIKIFIKGLLKKDPIYFLNPCKRETRNSNIKINECITYINNIVDPYLLHKLLKNMIKFKAVPNLNYNIHVKQALFYVTKLLNTRNLISHGEHIKKLSIRDDNKLLKLFDYGIKLLHIFVDSKHILSKKNKKDIKKIINVLENIKQSAKNFVTIRKKRHKISNKYTDKQIITHAQQTLDNLQTLLHSKQKLYIAKEIVNLISVRLK